VLLASELAVQQEVPLVKRCRPGRQPYDRWSRLVVPDPAVCRYGPPALAAQPGSLLRPSHQRPRRLPDRLEFQVGFQAPGAAVAERGYEPAGQPEQLDRAEWSARLSQGRPHSVNLAPA
jgi:hypothetical protein